MKNLDIDKLRSQFKQHASYEAIMDRAEYLHREGYFGEGRTVDECALEIFITKLEQSREKNDTV